MRISRSHCGVAFLLAAVTVVATSDPLPATAVDILTIHDPAIAVSPESQKRNPGQSASFTVTAVGTEPFYYQWWKDGAMLPEATQASLTLADVQAEDAGFYFVVVSNIYGTVTSTVTELSVNLATAEMNLNPGASGTTDVSVYSLAVQSDGRILLGGAFTGFRGQPRRGIARLNPDLSLDTRFDPGVEPGGASHPVYSLAAQPDGKILVAGWFTTLGGQPRNNIGRLHADGTVDNGFNPGANTRVSGLAVQPDGKILVADHLKMIRWNPDGTRDSGFRSFVGRGEGSGVDIFCLAVQPDGKILAGGNFGELGGMPRLYFGRVNPDGSLDEAFIPELDEVVQVVSVQPGGKILIGGRFSTLDGESRTHLARLLPDGTVDPDFRVDANAWVSSLAMQADGKILVGGRFTDLGGQKRNYLARLHANGILDSTFDPSPDGPVHALLVQEDGKILVGGSFYHMAGRNCSQMARLLNTDPAAQSLTHNGSSLVWERGGSSPQLSWTTFDLTTDGTEWSSLGSGTWIGNGWHLMNLLLPSNGTILAQGGILGGFDNASGYLAQAYYGAPLLLVQPSSRTNDANTTATFVVTPQGTEPFQFQWSKEGMPLQDTGNTVGSRTSSLVLSNVSLADVGSYRALIYNEFGTITSAEATLTVLDPAIAVHPASQTGHAGQGVGFTVTAAGTPPFSYRWWKDGSPLAEATESSLILENVQTSDAGEYQVVIENIHGTVTSVIASLTVNLATLDSDFNPGPNDSVFALAMQADGKILVGGHYSNMGGQARGNISRLYAEGAIDPDYNPSASSDVTTMAVQEDGKVLVGGRFTTLGGQPRRYIGRLNADGTLDPDFNPGADRYVYALALQPDGKILVGGGFRELAEESRSFLGRLNPDGTLDPGFDPGANQAIGCLAVQPDGKILVGGDFYYIGGKNLNRLARLNADGTVDDGFNAHADNWVSSLVVQADGKILVGGGFSTLCGQPRSYLGRLNSDGTLDNSFTTGVEEDDPTRITTVYSLALQTDGKILVGGYFNRLGGQPRYHIGRLYSDGTVDSEFDPIAGSAISAVYGLGLQSDGKILVGGSFSTLAGQPIGDLGRLYNTEPATQSLSVNGAILTWLRGGTSPEAWRTTLEISAPGGDWNLIGPGSRVLGGWQWNNVSVPANSTFRARGYVAGGQSNVSSWFVETLWEPVMETRAVLSVESVNGSVIRFGLTGQIQAQYTIETSPAVSPAPAWTPFLTLTLTNGLGWFDWTNAGDGQRFFRAVEE